jgi:hypothetical protein
MAGLSVTDIVTIIGNIAIALSFVIALVFGIAQVRQAARDRRERLTLETLREFQTREFADSIHRILYTDMPATYEALRALPEHEQVPFIQFAQQMESLGIQVAEGLIELDLVDKTLGSFVTIAWEKYRPAFTDLRVKTDDPFTGEYFQWLAELIDKRMKEKPRRPFYQTAG